MVDAQYPLTGVFLPLTTFSLVLRFLIRWKKHVRVGLDDYLIILSYCVYVGFTGLQLHARKLTAAGLRPTTPAAIDRLEQYQIISYSLFSITATIMTAAKFSILALYWRMFQRDRHFKISLWIVGTLCFLWWVVICITSMLQCTPVSSLWNPRIPRSKCFNINIYMVGVEVPNAILDFAVAAVAIRVIRKLHMNFWQKFGVAVIFTLCTVVAIVGLVRIGITFRPQAFATNAVGQWTHVQNALAIICANLPTYGPLLAHWPNPIITLRSYFSNRSDRSILPRNNSASASAHTDQSGNGNKPAYWKMDSGPHNGSHDRSITTTSAQSSSHEEDMIPLGSIGVTHSVRVESRKM